jgi:hypothetical protein
MDGLNGPRPHRSITSHNARPGSRRSTFKIQGHPRLLISSSRISRWRKAGRTSRRTKATSDPTSITPALTRSEHAERHGAPALLSRSGYPEYARPPATRSPCSMQWRRATGSSTSHVRTRQVSPTAATRYAGRWRPTGPLKIDCMTAALIGRAHCCSQACPQASCSRNPPPGTTCSRICQRRSPPGDVDGNPSAVAALAAVGFNPQSQPLWPYHWTIYWGLTQKIYRLEFDPEYTNYTCSSQTGPACVSPPRRAGPAHRP